MDGDQLVSRKRDTHSGPDFLSDLPLGIIHCILERVPIVEAVRTCILSRQWRYIWVTLPHLVFEKEDDPLQWKDLKTFIKNVLFLHKGPIHKFRLESSSVPENCPEVDHWLLCLSRNDIRELFLEIKYDDGRLMWVHSCLFSCQKLTHLTLNNCILPPPPSSFKGFSCLKSLVLFFVEGPSDLVESLVASSPILENFTYGSRSDSSGLRIRAPNLKTSDLSCNFTEIDLYAPLMAELSVAFSHWDFIAEQLMVKTSVCNLTKFLGCFPNLKMFTGEYFTQYLSIGIDSYDHSLTLHHLNKIELYGVSLDCPKETLAVVHLIMSAPNLQNLALVIEPFATEDASEAPPISFSDFGCTFNTLTDIKLLDLSGLPYELELIKFLLRSSTLLKMMTLRCNYELCPKVKSNLMTKLLRYSRASPNAEILFS